MGANSIWDPEVWNVIHELPCPGALGLDICWEERIKVKMTVLHNSLYARAVCDN